MHTCMHGMCCLDLLPSLLPRLTLGCCLLTQGPSFRVDGNLITWQKWRFRLGFNYR